MTSASESSPERVQAVLYTRAGCSLCERAATILDRLAQEGCLYVERVDIAGDAGLTEQYGARIPVVYLSSGERFEGRISEFRLRRALTVGA